MHADPSAAIQSWWKRTTDPLKAALTYHEAGLCVIPLTGKRPALSGWEAVPNDASHRTGHPPLVPR